MNIIKTVQLNEQEVLEEYYKGSTIKQIARNMGVSAGKVYYVLRDLGCKFRKSGASKGHKPSQETRQKISNAKKLNPLSEEARRKIAEAKRSKFNGLNGYGHIKPHCKGYVLAYAPLHPHAHADGYIMLHTIIMERSIGRYLKENEVVHHKNRNRQDNRIENLELMDKKKHMSMHMKERHLKREE